MKKIYQSKSKRTVSHFANNKMASYLTARSQELFAFRGQRMAIFANDYIGILVNQFGIFEREELDSLFEFLCPLAEQFKGATALDIGANIGNHSIYFSRSFSAVHAFEPSPVTFDLLTINSRFSTKITPHNLGLGDQRGTFRLVESPTNVGIASIKFSDVTGGVAIDITVERLDDLELDLSRLEFIKIDVEGFEANVVRGGSRVIKERQPLIVLEQHASEFTGGTTETISLLAQLGYRFCWQEKKPASRFWLLRRLRELGEVLFGHSFVMLSGDRVPPRNHTMLVAVPPRFQALLGIG